MERTQRHKRKGSGKKFPRAAAAGLAFAAAGIAVCAALFWIKRDSREIPEELLVRYVDLIGKQEYEKMYEMTDPENSGYKDQQAFIQRNSAIYEGIEIADIQVEILENDRKKDEGTDTVAYRMSFDTAAGNLHFENEMRFSDTEEGYKILWHDGLIFPELTSEDKVRIESDPALRGKILDRYDRMLAGPGTASSVGLVPGKLEDRETAFRQLSELLDMDKETIQNCLDAAWVKG